MACCHDVWDSADSKTSWLSEAVKRCGTFYRLLLKSLGISKVLLHCHTVEPEQTTVLSVMSLAICTVVALDL